MQKRTKKIVNIALNIVIGIVCVIILLLAVSTINNKDRGYNSIFGHSLYAVKSDSMKGDNKDSFNKGALVIGKVLKTDEQKKELEVGNVITFWAKDTETGTNYLNTHRIIEVREGGLDYITKGDNTLSEDPVVNIGKIVSVYKFHLGGIGNIIIFVQSITGFLVVVVIPSLLIVVYALYNLFRAYSGYNKAKLAAEMEAKLLQERTRDQAKHDANKLAQEEAKKAAEQAQAEKEAQLRAELEAKIKAEMEAEQAEKAKEAAKPAPKAKTEPASKPAAAKTTASKPAAPKKPAAAKTTASKPAAPKKPAAAKTTASKPAAPKKPAAAKTAPAGKTTAKKKQSAPKAATKEKADE